MSNLFKRSNDGCRRHRLEHIIRYALAHTITCLLSTKSGQRQKNALALILSRFITRMSYFETPCELLGGQVSKLLINSVTVYVAGSLDVTS
jgi:hypothetical protein